MADTFPPVLFKATVDSHVETLIAKEPNGFGAMDVAAMMGVLKPPKKLQRRIRQRLRTLCNNGVLVAAAHGIFLPSTESNAIKHVSVCPALLANLHRIFFNAGGFIQLPDILEALGRNEPDAERNVRTILSESPLFERYNPLPKMKQFWRLADEERAKVPVPGCWLLADLRLTTLRAGGGRLPWKHGLADALEAYQARIGKALRDARALWRLSPGQMTDGAVGQAMDRCFSRCAFQFVDPDGSSTEAYSVAQWWDDLKTAMGTEDAMAEAWLMLEGDQDHPHLLEAVDVALWFEIGARTKLDPALLSRGAVAYDWRAFAIDQRRKRTGTGDWKRDLLESLPYYQ